MAAAEPSIITLLIDKIQSGLYKAEAQSHRSQVTEPSVYGSISDAIRVEARAVPRNFPQFMEVRFCGISSGTLGLEEAAQQCEMIASRLVSLNAEMKARVSV